MGVIPAFAVLSVILAASLASASMRPGGRRDPSRTDSCDHLEYDHHDYTWLASEGHELDDEAMQAMPTSNVAYGWRRYRSGRCSYKGYEAPCPDHHHKPERDEFFWDSLYANPKPDGSPCLVSTGCCSGVCSEGICCPKGKKPTGGTCTAAGDCCSGTCVDETCCVTGGKIAIGQPCNADSQCCSDNCQDNACCTAGKVDTQTLCRENSTCCSNFCSGSICCKPGLAADGDPCVSGGDCCSNTCNGDKTCGQACFAGDTMVRIREFNKLVPIRLLETGQHVLCVASGDNMLGPSTLDWCEVKNWGHVQEVVIPQYRISFLRPDGSESSLTISPTHLMFNFTSGVAVNTKAQSIEDFGPFQTVVAHKVRTGDKIPVLLDPSDHTQGFIVVQVASCVKVDASGMYSPVISSPFIVADGVIAPLHVLTRTLMWAPDNAFGYRNAALQYNYGPLITQRLQENGTAGVKGDWGGKPLWPGFQDIRAAQNLHRDAGETLNFTVYEQWFEQRYQSWEADNSKPITLEDTVAFLASDVPWIKPSGSRAGPVEDDMPSLLNSL